VEAVKNCRNIGKRDMKYNDVMPKMKVNPESYVSAPASSLPDQAALDAIVFAQRSPCMPVLISGANAGRRGGRPSLHSGAGHIFAFDAGVFYLLRDTTKRFVNGVLIPHTPYPTKICRAD